MLKSRGFAMVFVVLGLGFLLAACGGGASEEELDQARQEGAQQAREQAQIEALEEKVKELEEEGGNGSNSDSNTGTGGTDSSGSGGTDTGSGPVTTCGDGVQVGANTSCAFAFNVAGEYGSNPGASTINAYSPTTGKYYTMTCSPWSDGVTVCRGGNNAAVFIGG